LLHEQEERGVKYSNEVYIIGAGGHAKVVVRTLQDLGFAVAAIFDDAPHRWHQLLFGVPILGPVDRIEKYPPRPALIAVGDNVARQQIAERYALHWLTAVHPQALVDSSVRLGAGTIVLHRAVIQPDTNIGNHVIINTAASVDHDCLLGNFVHLAPGGHLAGGVSLKEGVLFGIGAVAIPGVTIGAYSTVGAGAAVVSDVPAKTVAMGVPAKFRQPDARTGHEGLATSFGSALRKIRVPFRFAGKFFLTRPARQPEWDGLQINPPDARTALRS
jgi:sugar O-acyltransferase (sialic acid O-acetyltransferase NeuD family)